MTEAQIALWKAYHSESAAREKLSNLLRRNWDSSIAAGIDYENARPRQLSTAEWETAKSRSKRLYIYSGSVINTLDELNPDSDMGTLLFDRDGVLLRIYGSDRFGKWADEHSIRRGTCWSEQCIGANAFSIGIKRDKSTVVRGAENFARFLVPGAFYFAPVKLENGEVHGGICIVTQAKKASDYLLYLSTTMARSIELQLFWFDLAGIYGDISEGHGMLSLDQSNGHNHILTISREVIRMLRLKNRDYYYDKLENVIDTLPANKEFWELVNGKKRVSDKTITISAGGKKTAVSMSVSGFKEKKFQMNGVVIVLNSIKRINELVHKYSGNHARYQLEDIVGESKGCTDAVTRAHAVAQSDSNVLLLGESGVGKDIFAQAIHNASARASGPFVAVNCATFSKDLIGSELFGYESGAFTGAKKEGNIGKFELATGGTLFLDEIGDMPLDLQAVLLRVIETKSFMRVGGNSTIRVNVRILAATNKDLQEKISQGLFREDLFYRIGILRIRIPPLRDRSSDIILLAEHFAGQICARLKKAPARFLPEAKALLLQHSWPGNVRELQNLLEGVISIEEGSEIGENAIRSYLGLQETDSDLDDFPEERAQMVAALKACRNNRSKAAERLGMSRRTFYRRLEEYGLL